MAPTIPAASDRPAAGGPVTRVCGSHYAEEFDPGLESRTIRAGPVAMVASRVSPVPSGATEVRTFKLAIRVETATRATVRTLTTGTSLAYDRARFRKDNVYRLADGDDAVRFTGCPARPALFNGAVLTAGARVVELVVAVEGQVKRKVIVAAYDD